MSMFRIKWECGSCGQTNIFTHQFAEEDGWPDLFEVTCDNEECGQVQEVAYKTCEVIPIGHALDEES
jgi:uncharacterized Zn finger protein